MEKLLFTRMKTDLHINFYVSVLPVFKSFVLVFEQKEPMVHRLHDELKDVVRSFLACFMKLEKVKYISSKKLVAIDVTDQSLHKPISTWFVGNKAKDILASLRYVRKKCYVMTSFPGHLAFSIYGWCSLLSFDFL